MAQLSSPGDATDIDSDNADDDDDDDFNKLLDFRIHVTHVWQQFY